MENNEKCMNNRLYNEQIESLNKFLEKIDRPNSNISTITEEYQSWREQVTEVLESLFEDKSIAKRFTLKSKYVINVFSEQESRNNFKKVLLEVQRFLVSIAQKAQDESNQSDEINIRTACVILRRMLQHFDQHMQTLYHDPVHGKGTIQQDILNEIQIGNEYDLQRILFSLIKPVFPTARCEVPNDVGYGSIRFDIILNDYDLAIETKCSRDSMKERELTEEIGADITNYPISHLFVFIYDKDRVIKNKDAFVKNYTKNKNEAGKIVETFVLQPVGPF
ncbi:hypothetical protein ABWW58_16310 [Sporolactobacillus sp. STCC-11]|uniref:PD-(D/E)XK nuclease domain-containing protein n=1 Tax=Sporolactobacillus caesalpiniae TaxID=3230362 RepID=UPI003397ABDE